jgi:hypothetical protein
VREYVARFEQDDAARTADKALTKLFDLLPQNRITEEVLIKVVAVNSLLSTGILATYAVAKHICELDVDPKIEQGMPDVVCQIARVKIGPKKRCNYSFATKFCSYQAPDSYPKYDGYTEGLIWAYQKSYRFGQFERSELQDYSRYKAVVEDFKRHYDLGDFSFKQIDNFMWGYGRHWKEKK